MKTCKLLVAACGCVLAAQAAEIPSAALAADPRYRARHYEIDIPEGEYWWGGEVLEGLKQPFSRTSAKYAVDMRRRHGVPGGDKAAPVLLSSKGRWIWCEQAFAFKVSDGKLVIDTEKDAPIEQGRAEGGTLRAAYLDCSRRHFPPKGHPNLRFFSEPIINTWIALKYNQNEKEILEIADEFIANGVPPGVYMIDHTWHGDSFGDWNFHQGRFRDPKGMVKKLNEKGYPVMLWFDPHISTDTALYRWMRKEGMLLRKRDGWDTAESSWWPGKAAILDCTNPKTFAWLKDTCRRLMDDFGVEGFFFDAGDAYNYPVDAVPYDKLATPSDQVRAFHMIGMEVPYQQHRASWKMGGLPLMQTLRDKPPTWEGLHQCIADGCLSGLLGYPFVTFDMVGGGTVSSFEGEGAKFKAMQHFVRSMQVHALSPMVQFSLSPWKHLDAEHQAIIRDMVTLRQRWAGYIVRLAEESGRTGEPMMRLLEYAYPGHGYEEVSDQFLMGDRLMVAPQVVKDAATRTVHIPPGRWRADDGRVYEGPAVVEVATPLARLPHFEKLPAKDLEVMAVYYPHWHKYPKGMEWFGEKWDWSEAEWAFVKDPVVRFPGQINFKPFGGYYSGSDPKDVETEIALAANAGIDIFLYDYYWYNGEKTQEEAIEQGFLKAKNRDKMKFALMWCYHDRKRSSWRKKFGGESQYCMRLARKPEEFLGLIDYSIAHYFNQPEHWRHNGKLFFSIYNAWDMIKDYGEEGTKSALLEARRRVRAAGLGEIEFNAQNLWNRTMTETAERCGFDSLTSYGCNTYSLPNHRQRYAAGERLFDFAEVGKVLDERWKTMSSISSLPYYPIVPTGWDSTLRCAKDAKFPWPGPEVDYPYCGVFTNATDALFEKYLRAAKEHALADPKKPGVVYINAWNEYTEGCWLLPDNRRGDLRLRAIARVFGRRPADEYVFTSTYRAWEEKPVNQQAKTMRAPDVENVKYGPHPRQGMDVWFPGKARPAVDAAKLPALVVIHGGGWSASDRIPAASEWEPICRKAGIALVSVGYRFIQDGRDEHLSPPVRAPLDDAIAAIRFIQAHADEWKIDVTRIGLTGGSAGACSSLYAALQNDCELGIRAVYAASPQTSLDPKETREWIPNARYGSGAFGYGNFDSWLAHREECLPWIEKFSPATLLWVCTAAKAPAFFYSCEAVPVGGVLPKNPTCVGMFCVKFEEICRAKGIRCEKASREAIIKALVD